MTRNEFWLRGDLRALPEAFAWLILARIAIAVLPFRLVRQTASALALRLGPTAESDSDSDAQVARAVTRASRLLPGSRCLPQALSALLMHARRGERARVHIGVRPPGADEPFGAHAWMETACGTRIGGRHASEFATILTIDPFVRNVT